MCIVIDTNTWSSVLDKSSTDHLEFKPVYDWIFGEGGNGKIVYGVLYPKRFTIPKIYHGVANKDLLIDKNIAKICLPCIKTSKTKSKEMGALIQNAMQNK